MNFENIEIESMSVEELNQLLDYVEAQRRFVSVEQEEEEKPKVLTPYNNLERGKALVQTLSSPFHEYMRGLDRQRQERYQQTIEEESSKTLGLKRGK